MSTVIRSGNIQTMRGHTTNSTDGELHWQALGSDTGAHWEIYIKSTTRDSASDWGTSTYSIPYSAGGAINFLKVESMGNDIHRVLKYYLQDRYKVSNIESVRLNIVLKSD
tara:strand:+ start:11441 stop:11770 length:330 start_codon:yes stop_codon:yes gene_type:complete